MVARRTRQTVDLSFLPRRRGGGGASARMGTHVGLSTPLWSLTGCFKGEPSAILIC